MNRQISAAPRPRNICDLGIPGVHDANDRIHIPGIAPQVLRRYDLPMMHDCSHNRARGVSNIPPSGELPAMRCSGCGTAYNSSLFTCYRRQGFAIFWAIWPTRRPGAIIQSDCFRRCVPNGSSSPPCERSSYWKRRDARGERTRERTPKKARRESARLLHALTTSTDASQRRTQVC